MALRGARPANPSDIEAVCLTAAELLKTGQVAEAAVVLSRAQAVRVQAGDQILAHLLATVSRGWAIGFFPLTNKMESFSAASLALCMIATDCRNRS